MGFIEKKDPIVLNIKLTSKGREQLSKGELDFKYYALGDSEIDYTFNANVHAEDSEYTAFNASILKPANKNPNIISFITKNLSGDTLNEITNVPSTPYVVENEIESLGFFTNNNTEFISDSNHVKQPDAMIDMSNVVGGNSIILEKSPTYGSSGEEPAVGDILFVRWTQDVSTTGVSVTKTYPTPNLFYRITGITSGSLAGGSVNVAVDREIPDFSPQTFSSVYAGAMIYYNEINFSGDTVLSMSETDYLDEAVLTFLENSQCPTIVFPYWNMSIIFTEEIIGVQAGDLKYTEFKNRTMGGFVSYIQNQAPTYKKLGVIHYTNSSPANVYGEGFLNDTPTLDIPTIMWHKSTTKTLGTTLSPIGGQQLLSGLNIYYYDLGDPEGFVVGKVFPDLKIFVIEDQELLFAMSYKSNRSWTLPDYTAVTAVLPDVPAGIAVTWLQPVVNATNASLVCAQYCHSTSGSWLNFTGSKSLIGVEDTGYRVYTCRISGSTSTCVSAIDIGTEVSFDNSCVVAHSGDIYVATLSNVTGATSTSSYYFKGVIDTEIAPGA